MSKPDDSLSHPGKHVRDRVLPAGISVTDAAKRLGVGRPALSNFLNGKAGLSPDMALRLERAFGADRSELLEMQATYEEQSRRAGKREVAVRAFVPNFLTIKARQIEAWADGHIEARTHIAVLLRKLVHSTGQDLTHVDFPGYDNAERKGEDGITRAGSATPWVPEGTTYWEFGVDQKIATKANNDYVARLKSVPAAERSNSTFVFVTPRNWTGKAEWASRKSATKEWKSVRALDASDLEQWLEQSVVGQIWLAEQMSLAATGFETLDQSWRRWANASDPPMARELFAPSMATYRQKIQKWLAEKSPKPFVVAADSTLEALAFLACVFEDASLQKHKDRAAVFTSAPTLRPLLSSAVPFILIIHSAEVERELASAERPAHCIVYRPRNAVDAEPDIALDLLDYDAFKSGLAAMGIVDENVERLSRESGRSPTILRRRLSTIPAIRTPAWAAEHDAARSLIPLALVGAWHAAAEADREIVSFIADRSHDDIEHNVSSFLQYEDPPVWSAGEYRGVASKVDALFAVASLLTPADVDRFFVGAEYVLSETDPALELPEGDRWAAALYGKTRDHSAALRNGICGTLVILSVQNDLVQQRLGIDIAARVSTLIRKLLSPLSLEKLLSHNRDLPSYAEAAPDVFLQLVEDDLKAERIVFGLMKPVGADSFFSSPSRTGLLWAMECLAWRPQTLPRVSEILAQLSQTRIDDNWANKPGASLQSIFRSWMPQTAASVEQRCKAIDLIARKYPEVAWDICMDQVRPGTRIGSYSYKPRWRSDATGAGGVVTHRENNAFVRHVVNLLLNWPSHDARTLGDLVEAMEGLSPEHQTFVWDLIDAWSKTAKEPAKAALRERIRRFAFTRRGLAHRLDETARDRARDAYQSLEPRDPVIRHGWLFADHWIQESADELEDENYDLKKRDERVDSLRRKAMEETWTTCGFAGVARMLEQSGAAAVVGLYVARHLSGSDQRLDFVRQCLQVSEALRAKAEWCLQGFLSEVDSADRSALAEAISQSSSTDDLCRLLVLSPFDSTTWRILDAHGDSIRAAYWKQVYPRWGRHTPAELIELVDRLLEAGRPRAGFAAAHLHFKELETSRLKRLLGDIGMKSDEPLTEFRLAAHDISFALEALDGRPGVSVEEMAQLEFLFIEALDRSEHGIPNLEEQVGRSPALFVQAVALAYRRRDGGTDRSDWGVKNPDNKQAVAMGAHQLLDRMKRLPGTNDTGDVDAKALISWLNEVRAMCKEVGRAEIGDQLLGQLLARGSTDEGDRWPPKAVCEAMEAIASEDVGTGFAVATRNSRGAHWRDVGGRQEREIAAMYRHWAELLHFEYPFAGQVVEDIAKSYEREAEWHDTREKINKRLGD